MKNLILIFSFFGALASSNSVNAQVVAGAVPTATIAQQLNQLFSDYAKRFVNGKYVSNAKQIQDFNVKQDAFALAQKQSGNLKQILFITNDFEKDLTVKLYALVNEKSNLLALFYEKTSYYDEEGRSYLRFFPLATLADGIKFVPVNGTHALIVKGHYFTPDKGGTLQFNYLKDLRSNSWGVLNLFLINRGQGWGLFNLQYQPMQSANVKTWTSFLNGGVSDIVIK